MNKFKKKFVKQKLVILSAFIVGMLISIYIKSLDSSKIYISLNEKKKIENEIKYYENEIDKLFKLKVDMYSTLKEYQLTYKDDKKSIIDIMENELENLKLTSGYKDAIGTGIEIVIKDSENELKKGQNPNDLLVHDGDILRIINDLKKSGAESISINDERLISSSEIKCSGATISINAITHGQPFVIKAIGNIDLLKSSIISPQSYGKLLKDLYGISINIMEKNDIFIKSYKKD